MPASYPTAAKTFTTKNAGDTIQPAHINDIQTEVEAIESGLLNGTAPLNSSKSTVASLSVSGASTFAGAVTFSNDITANCTLTVTKLVYTEISGAPSAARIYSTVTALEFTTASTFTRLVLGTKDYDLSSEYSTASGLFTPLSSGRYAVNGRAWTQSTVSNFQIAIEVNDTIVAKALCHNSSVYSMAQIQTMVNLSSGSAGALCLKVYGDSTGRLFAGPSVTCLEIERF